MSRLALSPRMQVLLAIGLFAAVTAATCVVAVPQIFNGFPPYDDEGYLLLSLQGFLGGGDLYDEVFTQYGPFYYLAWGGVFGGLGLETTHDTGRIVTLVVWVGAGLLVGCAVWALTRKPILGALAQVLAFSALSGLVFEPMHPSGIVCALLGALVLVSTLVGARRSGLAMGLVGAILASLLLIKINVGVFGVAAVALTLTSTHVALGRRSPILRLGIEAAFVLAPLVLMSGLIGEPWVQRYALHVSAAALALVIVLRTLEPDRGEPPTREIRWLIAGGVGTAAAACLLIVALGTSPAGLVEGVLIEPLGLADAFALELQISDRLLAFDLLAIMIAGVYWYTRRVAGEGLSVPWRLSFSAFSIFVGVAMLLSVVGLGVPFDAEGSEASPNELVLLAFAWVPLVAVGGGERRSRAFALRLLPALAVMQALYAYPVAGTQIGFASFLLVAVAALCVDNGVRGFAGAFEIPSERRAVAALSGVAGLAIAVLVALGAVREPWAEARGAYDGGTPVGLPGAERLRLPDFQTTELRGVTAAIERDCDGFITSPGMNSFYLWTGQDPPSGLNATTWMTLFDAEQQSRVVASTQAVDRLCLVRNRFVELFWIGGAELPPGPLVTFVEERFTPIETIGPYELMRER